MTETYRMYRRLLVHLQGTTPGLRLTLKDPTHALHLQALLKAIPEALVVQTHRDPLECVPSAHKLTMTTQATQDLVTLATPR
jgi:hypothetical protein